MRRISSVKIIFSLLLFFCAQNILFAQTTAISGTVTDADGFVWLSAGVTVDFVPNPATPNISSYTLAGQNLATYAPYNALLHQTTTANANTGLFSLTLLDNTQISPSGSTWRIQIKSNTSAPSVTYSPIQVFGASQNLSTYLSSNSTAPRFPATPGAYGYADVELTTVPYPGGQYFNTTTGQPRFWNGSIWNNYGVGAGVVSINNATGAATFSGAVTCTGTTSISCNFTGGAASFNLNIAELGALTTGAVLTHTGHYVVPANQSLAQVNTLLSTYPNATFEFQNNSPNCYLSSTCDLGNYTAFTNPNFQARITHDGLYFTSNRINIDQGGVVCDARQMYMTFTSGSKIIVPSSTVISPYDVGKVIWAWNSTTQQVWESQVQSVTGSTLTVATAAPWTQSTGVQFLIGTDNTTNFQNALTFFGGNTNFQGVGYTAPAELTLSAGGCMTHTLDPKNASFMGAGSLTNIYGAPGEDVFATPDAYTNGGEVQTLVHLNSLGITVNAGIDATQSWTLVNDAGTTSKTANYRPAYVMTAASNYELGPQWCIGSGQNNSGCGVGVGNTNGTTLLCVPNSLASGQIPSVGQQILFPYTSSGLIETTVVSTAGTCAAGTTPFTLGVNIPTATQGEYYIGTNFQHTAADFPAGRSYPYTISVSNSIAPSPAGEIGFAPYGMLEIGAEQCTYYGYTYSTNQIKITGCAGTSVDHPSTSYIAALNPYSPTTPMPVTPTINTGTATPAGASWFPGHNIGNCAFAFPQSNGATNQALAWSYSNIENVYINIVGLPAYENTCGFYFVGLPYSSHFKDIRVNGTQYGIVQGLPPVNNHNFISAQPTADASTWTGVTLRTGYGISIINSNQVSYSNFDVYSALGTATGSSTGCAGAYYFTDIWDDQTGGGSGPNQMDNHNLYVEPESGSLCGTEVLNEFDGNNNIFTDFHQGGGGYNYIGGIDNKFVGGNFNNASQGFGNVAPLINWGAGTTLLFTESAGSPPYCNTFNYGSTTYNCTFINWGPRTYAVVRQAQNAGVLGNVVYGNNRTVFDGQSAETFRDGKVGPDFYIHSGSGLITPDEFVSRYFDPASMTSLWTFDASAYLTQANVTCAVGTNTSQAYCEPTVYGYQTLTIGPGQRLAPTKYTVYINAKVASTSNTVYFGIGRVNLSTAVRTGITGPIAAPLTNAYPSTSAGVWSTTVDLSSYSGYGLALEFYGGTNTDTVSVQYISFVPLANNLNTQQLTIVGSGAPTIANPNGGITWQTAAPTTGCGSTYSNGYIWLNSSGTAAGVNRFYICDAATTTWNAKF